MPAAGLWSDPRPTGPDLALQPLNGVRHQPDACADSGNGRNTTAPESNRPVSEEWATTSGSRRKHSGTTGSIIGSVHLSSQMRVADVLEVGNTEI